MIKAIEEKSLPDRNHAKRINHRRVRRQMATPTSTASKTTIAKV